MFNNNKNWYKRIKTADAKNKIKKFFIENKFDQAFIYKYEDIIPWQSIKSQEDFSAYVNGLSKELIAKSNTLESPESMVVVKNWIDLIESWSENGLQPSRLYLILKPIMDWAETHRAPPPIVMPSVAEDIVDRIKNNPSQSINFLRTYKKEANPIPHENGWHHFPKGSDPTALYLFTQGGGWCLSTIKYSKSYIEGYDVYIYVDNNQPVVGLIIENNSLVSDVRGRCNVVPHNYRQVIFDKVKEGKWNPASYSVIYQVLEGMPEINELLLHESDTNNQVGLEKFNNLLSLDNTLVAYSGLEEGLKNDPKVLSLLNSVAKTEIAEYGPVETYNIISPDARKAAASGITDGFNIRVESGYAFNPEHVPNEIASKLDIKKLTHNWVQRSLAGYFYLQDIPRFVWEEIELKDIIDLVYSAHAHSFDELPQNIQKMLESKREIIESQLRLKAIQGKVAALERGRSWIVLINDGTDNELRKQLMEDGKEIILDQVASEIRLCATQYKEREMNNRLLIDESERHTLKAPRELIKETKELINQVASEQGLRHFNDFINIDVV